MWLMQKLLCSWTIAFAFAISGTIMVTGSLFAVVAPFSEKPEIGVDSNGNQIAVWRVRTSPDKGTIHASTFSYNGVGWTVPVTISGATHDTYHPIMAFNSTDGTVVIYGAVDSLGGPGTTMFATYLPLTGVSDYLASVWSAPVMISLPIEDARNDYKLSIQAGPGAKVLAGWTSYGNSHIVTAEATFGGGYTALDVGN